MRKRKGASSGERGETDVNCAVNFAMGKITKKKTRLVNNREQHADGVEAKSELTARVRAKEEGLAKVTSKVKTKRKRRDGAEQEDVAEAKNKVKKKRARKSVTEVVADDTVEECTLEDYVSSKHGVQGMAESKLKRKKIKKPVIEPEGDLDGNDDSARPGSRSAMGVKYVPPHLRHAEKGSEERIRLVRRIRGLLNRLTEANVESITSDISTIFQANGRRLVTEIISNEILGACGEGPRGNDQYAAVFAAFVTGMSATSGMDFGANFVAALATSFEDQYQNGDSLAVRNLALLLSHLYNFHLLPSEVLYQVLAVLCKRFEELDVSTVLTILQSCGMGLRGDDPMAMKDFVVSIQLRTAEAKAALLNKGDLSKRVQFMLETICDIKNNKRQTKEVPTQSRLKKWLQKMGVEDVRLRAVTWNSLLDPVKKGQWWLPSAGNTDQRTDDDGKMAGAMDADIPEADKMLQLAASQRMNTDSRTAVFCMVMSGEDYIDAFEKLLRMKLPGTQDREVLRVIVECCLQEKLFNKYYSLLAAKLCDYDKNHKFTLQYCLWDHFKQLDTMELRRSANLARFLAHMIGLYSLSLAVLKAVDFTDPSVMTAKVVMHFRIFLETLLTEYSEEVIWNCFSRVAAPPNLATFRDGLALFLHRHIKQSVGGNHGDKEVKRILGSRYRLAKKGLANIAGVVLQ
ncbi:unnamed protein product [Calypogeia fissa]